MPFYTAAILTVGGVLLIIHIVSTYSALAQIIMETGGMSSHRVLDKEYEEEMLPPQLAEELLKRTREARLKNVPVNLQYRDINQRAKVRRRQAPDSSNERMLSNDMGLTIDQIADVDPGD
jgi:hypothetical protein